MRLFNIVSVFLLVVFSTSAIATENKHAQFTDTSIDNLYVANDGEVFLTFLSKEAGYSDDLYLVGTAGKILNNQTAMLNQQFSIGSFKAGTELIFSLFANDISTAFYSGKAQYNLDGISHTAYKTESNNSVIVGFEDLFNGGDKDYDDLVFSLSNVSANKLVITQVPEPETYAMFLTGLFLLGLTRRRKS